PVTTILRIKVIHNKECGTINLSQPGKIEQLTLDLGISDSKPLSTPLLASCNLEVIDSTPINCLKLKYCTIVGALLYIALSMWSDILYPVVYLTHFLCVYDHMHFLAVKHVLIYLLGTIKQTVCYKRCSSHVMTLSQLNQPLEQLLLRIHGDASYGTDKHTTKSVSRHITLLAGGPIAWYSRLQLVIALSSTEAELITLTDATHQALYLQKLYIPFSLSLNLPTDIFCDNQSTLHIIKKPPFTYHAHLKHFSIKEGFIHGNLQAGHIAVHYVPSNNNLADFLTKAVPTAKLKLNKIKLNLHIHD
ncbi:polyprotein, partial [Acanthamoeba castellanii str. Neff]